MAEKILIVGFGPGSPEHITGRARSAIVESEVIIGYHTYVNLIRDLVTQQEIVRTGMTEEVGRAQKAVQLAREGKTVAVISSGDAGVYGMAGLVFEVLIEQGWHPGEKPSVEVVPGISAINSCASLLGAPIMHDACTISLSDHLTPWEIIERRLEAAAGADFVIALYNPRSGRRTRQIVEAQRILLKYRPPQTPVGLVKSAYRKRQNVTRTTLGDMLNHDIGMLTTVIIGNSATFYHGDLMITPRGYQRKYSLDSLEQRLRPGQRLQVENEPWSLNALLATADTEVPDAKATRPDTKASRDGQPTGGVEAVREDLRELAEEAVARALGSAVGTGQRQVLEVGVAPGVANKKFSPGQLAALAELAGEEGEIEYTTAHQMVLRLPTGEPERVLAELRKWGLWVFPVGDVVKVKACDFCDGEKHESIPYAEELTRRVSGLKVPKELCIGFNGCAMSCYGAVNDDIGLVFRKGRFDLFLGGKTMGRNAQPGQRVAEGIPAENIVELLEEIVLDYQSNAFPGERFHKYFKRVGEICGFAYREVPPAVDADTACGS